MLVYAFDVEKIWDSLTIRHVSADDATESIDVMIITGNTTSILFPGGDVVVEFCSDRLQEFGGFALNLHSVPANDTGMGDSITEFACLSGVQFILAAARCDGEVDCYDFSDEMNCGNCGPDYFHCRSGDICVRREFRCDGWFDCPHRDDEENCGIAQCPDRCKCGEKTYYDGHGIQAPPCALENFVPFWINCSDTWSGDHARNSSSKATIVYLNHTPLFELHAGDFLGLGNVHALYLSSCQLRRLTPGLFHGLHRVYRLDAINNSLTYLENGTFEGLINVRVLYLEFNMIQRLDEGCFRGMHNVFLIDFENSSLSDIWPGAFRDIGGSLSRLVLDSNNLTSINQGMFYGLENSLQVVNFQDNPIGAIEPHSFSHLMALDDLHLRSSLRSYIKIYPDMFESGPNFQALFVYDPRMCCIAPDVVNCVTVEPAHPLFTCRRTFLQNVTIKIFIWILSISALIGNACVIIMRMRSKPSTTVAVVQSILISNLAVSDFLMGVYMLILAIMDVVIGETYFWEGRADEWRASVTCQIAGFISFLSSEASVFLVTLISIDRFICIVFPFSERRLGVGLARVVVAIIWLASILLGMVSVLVYYLNPDAYSLSDVCVGLPLIRKHTDFNAKLDDHTLSQYNHILFRTVASSSSATWQFSIAVFLGINFISFIIILICYVAIFIKVRFARAEAGRRADDDIKMALKMSLIVGTDFFCWMPIIILGILVQADFITLTSDIYAWLVVFVLPINSSLNPYLYTIFYKITG
ncbi:uncharacterized protein [Diadema antillarum]|uniref:uncharacterized protein n=1 Tax=Diadema antillarum TaxID=105358 RepID=UPI003A8C8829